jgi:signal transduction histidine kinase
LDNAAIGGLVVNSRDVTETKNLEEKVTLEKIIKQKEITEAVITAQESERSEIGRELHDNVNQLLTAAKLYTNMAKTDKENKQAFLNTANTYTITAIEEIRKLSKTLITPLIKDIGLNDSIKELIDDIMLVHPVKIIVTNTNFNEEKLNEKFKLNVFRIVQEQINNILKHATANNIAIIFETTKDHFIISINDDGIGFDSTKRKKGIGISNIISRAALYKGDVIINTKPGKGCRVTIDFIKTELLRI